MSFSALARRYGRRPSKFVPGARVRLTVDDEVVTGRVVEAFDGDGRRMLRIELDHDEDEPAAVVEAPASSCRPAGRLPWPYPWPEPAGQ